MFEITPTSLTVAVELETATFQCQHLSCDGIGWRVNGMSLDTMNPPNITTDRILLSSADVQYTLTIVTLLEYNQTNVECVAIFFDRLPVLTETAVLLIQGLFLKRHSLSYVLLNYVYQNLNAHACHSQTLLVM